MAGMRNERLAKRKCRNRLKSCAVLEALWKAVSTLIDSFRMPGQRMSHRSILDQSGGQAERSRARQGKKEKKKMRCKVCNSKMQAEDAQQPHAIKKCVDKVKAGEILYKRDGSCDFC